MKVLLTGGFGYLGGRLALGLRARGHEVVLAGRRVRESGSLGMATAAFDVLSSVDDLRGVVRAHAADTIVHLAALDEIEAVRDPDLAVRVSGEGTRRLIEACKGEGLSRFVYFSTFHVYGRWFPSRIDEDTATKASHPYAVAHLAGEGFCREANETGGPSCVVFRMSNGYGAPADLAVERWTLVHNAFCKEAVTKGTVTLASSGTQRRDFVWLDDVAQATDLALRASREALGESVFALGGGKTLTIFELASVVAARATEKLGREIPVVRPSSGPESPDFTYAIDRLRALGYRPNDRLADETDTLLARLVSER